MMSTLYVYPLPPTMTDEASLKRTFPNIQCELMKKNPSPFVKMTFECEQDRKEALSRLQDKPPLFLHLHAFPPKQSRSMTPEAPPVPVVPRTNVMTSPPRLTITQRDGRRHCRMTEEPLIQKTMANEDHGGKRSLPIGERVRVCLVPCDSLDNIHVLRRDAIPEMESSLSSDVRLHSVSPGDVVAVQLNGRLQRGEIESVRKGQLFEVSLPDEGGRIVTLQSPDFFRISDAAAKLPPFSIAVIVKGIKDAAEEKDAVEAFNSICQGKVLYVKAEGLEGERYLVTMELKKRNVIEYVRDHVNRDDLHSTKSSTLESSKSPYRMQDLCNHLPANHSQNPEVELALPGLSFHSYCQVVVTDYENPSSFYLKSVCNAEYLRQWMDSPNDLCFVDVGCPVDLKRARIERQDGQMTSVRLLQTGTEECLHRSKVFPLPSNLSEFPELAFKCWVHGLKDAQTSWTKQNAQDFESLLEGTSIYAMAVSKADHTFGVKLALREADGSYVDFITDFMEVAEDSVHYSPDVFDIEDLPSLAFGTDTLMTFGSLTDFADILHLRPKVCLRESELERDIEKVELKQLRKMQENQLVLASYVEENQTKYYRATVQSLDLDGCQRVKVFYIDFGNEEIKDFGEGLFEYPSCLNEYPCLSVRVKVTGVEHIKINTFMLDSLDQLIGDHDMRLSEIRPVEGELSGLATVSARLSARNISLFHERFCFIASLPVKTLMTGEEKIAVRKLEEGSSHKVFVSHVDESTETFFVVLQKQNDLLELMSSEASAHYESNDETVDPIPGKVVMVKEGGRLFARAACRGKNTLQLIDVGAEKCATRSDVFPLLTKFLAFPKLAYRCKFYSEDEDVAQAWKMDISILRPDTFRFLQYDAERDLYLVEPE